MFPLFKVVRPKVATSLLLVLFILFQFHFFKRYNIDLDSIIELKSGSRIPDNKVYLNDKDYIASPYGNLRTKHGENLNSLDYHDKCLSYFDELYQTNPEWANTDFKELPYERYIFEHRDKFVKHKIEEYKKKELKEIESEHEKDLIIKEKDLEHFYELEWKKVVQSTRITEQRMVDASTHMRVYGACYLDSYGQWNTLTSTQAKTQNINDQCHDIEVRLFQWISRKNPLYKRWDGTTLKTMPVMSDYISQDVSFEKKEKSSCYLRSLRDGLNGKGITLSAADKHLDQLIQLLGVLRAIGNKLPIQIVHSGDLSDRIQERLVKMARSVKKLDLSVIDDLDSILKQHELELPNQKNSPEVYAEVVEKLLPKQELWFVDVTGSIADEHLKKFEGFGNKLLAYFFNSFEHSILIDTDTVPVVDMDQYIFGSKFYREHGAYFFKDRELYKQNSESDEIFYTKLMPSTVDNALFAIPEITDFTLKNRFIGERFAHLMESGVVAIDKRKHFLGVLATLQLALWQPVTNKVWGDKELFWLGMSTAGDEDYYLNYWPAGSIGQITPRKRRLIDDKTDERRSKLVGNELCSIHPAHVSSEDNSTVLWWNSGFSYCKFLDASVDDMRFPLTKNLFDTSDELKEMYASYQKMENIIVPKPAEHYVDNKKGENKRGWEKMDVCRGYMWCAYDAVGGDTSEMFKGLKRSFDDETKALYRYYGSVYQHAGKIVGVSDQRPK